MGRGSVVTAIARVLPPAAGRERLSALFAEASESQTRSRQATVIARETAAAQVGVAVAARRYLPARGSVRANVPAGVVRSSPTVAHPDDRRWSLSEMPCAQP